MVPAYNFDAARSRIELTDQLEHASVCLVLLGRLTQPDFVGRVAALYYSLRMMPSMNAKFDIHAMFCYYTPQFAPQNHSGIAQR